MVVTASRQPGLRPETIRTRIARFMPARTTGWSVSWSACIEHAEDIANDHELRAAEHLGCYGAAVAHALAQAELTAERLRLTADCTSADSGAQTITIEVRAMIDGPAVDPTIFDAIVRRAEPSCPVLKGLASEVAVRLIAILDEPGTEHTPARTTSTSTERRAPASRPSSSPSSPAGDGDATSHMTDGPTHAAGESVAAAPASDAPVRGSDEPMRNEPASSAEVAEAAGGSAATLPSSIERTQAVKPAGLGWPTMTATAHRLVSGSARRHAGSGSGSGRGAAGTSMSHMLATPGAFHSGLIARLGVPKWLSTRLAVMLVVAFGMLAALPTLWSMGG